MKYTIITDSCTSLFAKDLSGANIDFHVVPLTLMAGGKEFRDDENLNTADFVKVLGESKTCGKSACPNPDAFYDIMKTGENVIVVTISSKLSATHASAINAGERFKRDFPQRKLYIQDSLSAASGQDLILVKLRDLIDSGRYSFDEITVKIAEITKKTRVRFLLQDLQNLVKNGRMSKMAGKLLSLAHVKLVCGDDNLGEIKKVGLALGTRRGLVTLTELPKRDGVNPDEPIVVTHVLNEPDATFVKTTLAAKMGFKNIIMRAMRGLASLYAADKGIVIAYQEK
jgi:DegV family protein with EDD domain